MCPEIRDKAEPDSVPRHDITDSADVHRLVDAFYAKVLKDRRLAPIFLEVAKIDLEIHKQHIYAYWEKLLLDRPGYYRHTMNIHRHLNKKHRLQGADFEQWLRLFRSSADNLFRGPGCEKAKRIAANVAANMQRRLGEEAGQPGE